MKVNRLTEYSPGYPSKKGAVVKLGAIAAAAVLAVGTAGCKPRVVGDMEYVDPTEYVRETDPPIPEGEPAVDTETPGFPETTGEPAPISTDTVTDKPELVGDVIVDPGDGD